MIWRNGSTGEVVAILHQLSGLMLFPRYDLVDEVIAPMNLAFHPAQLLGFSVNLAVLLYFKGVDPHTALPEAWLRDERGRQHTDLLLLSSGENAVTFTWAPESRPFGYVLPYCACELQAKARWRHQHTGTDVNGRTLCQYKCTVCNSKLRLWFSSGSLFTRVQSLGTAYVQSSWPLPKLNIVMELEEKMQHQT
jgi:hypothetical protein